MRTNRIYEIRLIVAGSRTFHDYKLAKEKLDRIVFGLQEDYPGAHIVIISGDAKGADQIWHPVRHGTKIATPQIPSGVE